MNKIILSMGSRLPLLIKYDKERLPQRMQDVLKTIGENAVLFNLYVRLTNFPDWNVYQNLEDKGCDIVLINSHKSPPYNKIRIEVKTRQRLHSTAKNTNNTPHFTLSEHENKCDFLVGYWFEENHFYIVPTEFLSPSSSNGKKLFKYIPKKINDEYCNNWNPIMELMKEIGE